MLIKLYKTEDDRSVVNKTLTNELSVQGTMRDVLDTFSPEVMLAQDVKDYNYMYIPSLDRYYFVNGCTIVRTGLYQLKDVEEDVLMSLKSQFLDVYAIIDKTASSELGDEYINDGSFITSSKSINQLVKFPEGFNDTPDYILLTAGGTI